ncbi:MAG TPA: zf-HC2 domain-containing protein [Ramlibacter sp.]|nr:zf-HC2 domain-containing protein [Ramlibacter sp.]
MTARVFQLDSDEHRAVQLLLPWYVSGTLPDEELALVQGHLVQCPRCQADAVWQDALRTAAPATRPTAPAEVDRQWADLSQRLEAARPSASRWLQALRDRLRSHWMTLALGLQGVTMVAALTLTWWAVAPRDDLYRGLGGASNAPSANALVVFRSTASEADIRKALRANRAQLVGGPTVTDAYLLHLSPLSTDALSRLRADRAVLRVESLEGDAK